MRVKIYSNTTDSDWTWRHIRQRPWTNFTMTRWNEWIS